MMKKFNGLAALFLVASCTSQTTVVDPTLGGELTTDGAGDGVASRAVERVGPSLEEALAGAPLMLSLRDIHEYGCSQTSVSESYEGSLIVTVDSSGLGQVQLTIQHRDISTSWVDDEGPIEQVSHRRYTWSLESRREGEELTLELTPAPGCELINDTPPTTIFGCMPETPVITLVCSVRRAGEVDLSTVEPLEGLSRDAVVLWCQSVPEGFDELRSALWFMREPFVLAPAPGVQISHFRGDNFIEGELLRPEDS